MYFPKVMYIETTNLCNAECVMCPHKMMTRAQLTMTDEVFGSVVQRCRELDPHGIQIFMHKEGEPLMDAKISERIAVVKRELPDNETAINTNAMLLSEEQSERLIASGLDTIYFSVDGFDKESYSRVRVGLDYDTVSGNIRTFFDVKAKMHSDIRVIMQTLTQDDDDPSGEKFRHVWNSYPCEFYIKRMHSYLDGGHSSQTRTLSATQLHTCPDPFRILVIYADGSTGLCCWDYNNEYCAGNIASSSLLDIFNGARASRLRDAITSLNAHSITPCSRCARVFGQDSISPS